MSCKREESECRLLYFLTCSANAMGFVFFFQIIKIYIRTCCPERASSFNSSDPLEHFKEHRRNSRGSA